MAATSLQPLLDRLYEVLCDGRGSAFQIPTAPTDHSFDRGIWPGMPPDEMAILARERKRVWVAPTSLAPVAVAETGTSRRIYRVELELRAAYALPDHPEDHATVLRQFLADVALDGHRVDRALRWPPNVERTEAGADTGVQGGVHLLRWERDEFRPELSLATATARLEAVVALDA